MAQISTDPDDFRIEAPPHLHRFGKAYIDQLTTPQVRKLAFYGSDQVSICPCGMIRLDTMGIIYSRNGNRI